MPSCDEVFWSKTKRGTLGLDAAAVFSNLERPLRNSFTHVRRPRPVISLKNSKIVKKHAKHHVQIQLIPTHVWTFKVNENIMKKSFMEVSSNDRLDYFSRHTRPSHIPIPINNPNWCPRRVVVRIRGSFKKFKLTYVPKKQKKKFYFIILTICCC